MRSFRRSVQTARIACFMMATLSLSPQLVHARPCSTVMKDDYNFDLSKKLVPTWTTTEDGRIGLQALFAADGACSGCHSPSGVGAHKYITCSACHSGAMAGMDNPDWLNFAASDGSAAKLLRNSYSAPGYTKASAALFRATSGSMPPGQDGWCDEIVTVFEEWIANGYPN